RSTEPLTLTTRGSCQTQASTRRSALWKSSRDGTAAVFEKRGLKVVLNGQDDAAAPAAVSSTDGSRFSFGPTKFGVRLAGGMFGVDLSSKKSSSEK
ncbi:hypothetical protein CSPX01_15750, partial [Colletotrichum filicis]